jgi:hypothetical protein
LAAEIKRYLRDRARIISSFVQPLLWLFIFGSGIRFSGTTIGNLTSAVHLPRNHWADASLHFDVYGHLRDMGQRVWVS